MIGSKALRGSNEATSAPPAELGGVKVEQIDDLSDGFEQLPPTDALRFHLADGSRVMARPSGTEPKLKFYLDARSEQSEPEAAAHRIVQASRTYALCLAPLIEGHL